jgi:hypothetical protein
MDRFSTIAAENYIIQQHELASPISQSHSEM